MNRTKQITTGALIAALYVLLTWLSNLFGMASGVVQFRISEGLYALACFTPVAVPGLFIGCLISNTITGCVLPDIIFGSLATLIGAMGTRLLRQNKYLAMLPPVIANAVVVPLVLKYAYGVGDAYWFCVLTVTLGELVSCVIFGLIIYEITKKTKLIQ